MKTILALAALVAVGSVAAPRDAAAIGCLSGAAVGGVAGHFAGHHGLLGAAAGCAVGHHEAVVRHRRASAAYNNGGAYSNRPYQQ
jgi:outer membrane lipoprotein SlyB